MAFFLVGITAIFFAISAKIFLEFNNTLSTPYMDEIFHIPQAQNYCHGNYFHWNNKITTLPGVYIFSQFFLNIYSKFIGKKVRDACSVLELRFTNILFITISFHLIYLIIKANSTNLDDDSLKLKTKRQKKKETTRTLISNNLAASSALILTSFPLLYFFSFLYYTDVGSTLFVLMTYYMSITSRHWLAAVAGTIAILFRQTNIVWVGFSCITALIRLLKDNKHLRMDDTFFVQVYQSIVGCLKLFGSVLLLVFPYMIVLGGFVAFVVKNEGIVVGDRSSHEACFNFPQFLYFTVFTLFFSCFILLRYLNMKKTLGMVLGVLTSIKLLLASLVVMGTFFAAVRFFTYEHLYLISDNRHYTFYIWRKVFGLHPHVKYALVPVYFVAFLIIWKEMSYQRSSVWITAFLGCTVVALVPQKLLEFRYFIVPYLLFRLNIKQPNWGELLIEAFIYISVNAFTMLIFLTRTHTQDGHEGQRIMW